MVKKADTNVCSFEKRTLVFFPCVRPLRWYKIRRANNTSKINSFGCCKICTRSYIFIYTRFRLFIYSVKRQIRKQDKRLFFNTENDKFSHHHLVNTILVGECKLFFFYFYILYIFSIILYVFVLSSHRIYKGSQIFTFESTSSKAFDLHKIDWYLHKRYG